MNDFNYAEELVNLLYKDLYGKLVSSLLRFSTAIDLESVEDIAHETFTAAFTNWQTNGIPLNPRAWIYKVAKNKAYNKIRENSKVRSFLEDEDFENEEAIDEEEIIKDEKLRLLFSCAHPDFAPKVQVAITLKYVANVRVEAIAKAFALSVDGIDKMLLRARQKIKTEKILLDLPDIQTIKKRVSTVNKVLYLIFNEGYKSSVGQGVINESLCEEAMILTKILIESSIGNNETVALYALMLFNSSRFKTRLSDSGELLDLEEQNRQLWDKKLIVLGEYYLNQSKNGSLSSYHYEASIAYLHCIADDFKKTDWRLISKLYYKLSSFSRNPFVELNYAIALFYLGETSKSEEILYELKKHPYLNQYYLLNVALGKLNLDQGNKTKAKEFFSIALRQTEVLVEKRHIQKLISKCDDIPEDQFGIFRKSKN